jgi:tetratricopeptide (TPR) repeat protein
MEGRRVGPYRLETVVGAGGMGTVWKASVESSRAPAGLRAGQTVALKVIHPHLLAKPGFFKRFLREAELGKAVRHENVVRTYDVDATEVDGRAAPYLVMEYVEGQTLRGLLTEIQRVPEELCRHVGREVARALAAIHAAGIVHRDLKPENVLVTRNEVVKVMDLGVAHLQDEALRLSETGQFVGSVLYGAPEQFDRGGKDLDGRVDQYGLGLLLYELFAGRHPFRDDDISAIIRKQLTEEPRRVGDLDPQVSAFFEEVVATCLAKDREKRFPSAGDLADALEQGEASAWWQRRSQEIRAVTRRPLRRIRIPRETACYGREEETKRLAAAWGKARAGEGQVVLVTGEAGVGKSRLVDEFTASLQREGEDVNFLFGAYPPGGAATAQGAWSTAFVEHFGTEDLEKTLQPYLTVTPLLVPAFAALLRGEPQPAGREALTQDAVQTVFVHAARALAAERPTVILIDELHFAPDEGRALFAALALAAPGHRLLLLGTARRDLPEEWIASLDRLEHVSRLPLDRLSPRALQRLLSDALRSERLAEDLAARIALKSDGNPFFVFEILGGLRERGMLIRRPDGGWSTTSEIREIEIPSSVKDLVAARIASLEGDDRDLLDVAACAGFEFDPGLAGDALGMGRIPTLKRLARIERTYRIVRSVGERYVFDHHQVQEVLHSSLSAPLAREYHAAIADALERREGALAKDPEALDPAVAVTLCEQFLRGGQGARATRYLERSLAYLSARTLAGPAADLARRALAEPGLLDGRRRIETLLQCAGHLDLLGRRREEAEALAEAVALARREEDPLVLARALRALGAHHWARSQYEQAREAYEESRILAARAGDRRLVAAALGGLGNVARSLGDGEGAQRCLGEMLSIARDLSDARLQAEALVPLAGTLQAFGRYEEAHAQLERALVLSRETGDRRAEGIALVTLGIVLGQLGWYEDARVHLEEALAAARGTGDRHTEGLATGHLGIVHGHLGRPAASLENPERWLAIAREIGDRNCEGSAIGSLGTALCAVGRPEEAREQHERHLAIAKEIGDRLGREHALQGIGVAADALGREDDALRSLEEAAELQRESGHPRGLAYSLLALGRLHAAAGRFDAARHAFAEAYELGRALGLPGPLAVGSAQLAALPGGEPKAAAEALVEHEDRLGHAERLECRWLLHRATKERRHLEEAHRLLLDLRDATPKAHRDSLFTGVALRRDVLAAWKELRASPN